MITHRDNLKVYLIKMTIAPTVALASLTPHLLCPLSHLCDLIGCALDAQGPEVAQHAPPEVVPEAALALPQPPG